MIPNTHNIDPILCEVSTSNSFEDEEQLKKNVDWEDNHFLKDEVEDITVRNGVFDTTSENRESHASKEFVDEIEDDDLKYGTSRNEDGGIIHEDFKLPLCRDSFDHMEDDLMDQFVKLDYKEHRDKVSEIIKKDLVHTSNISNFGQVENTYEELEE